MLSRLPVKETAPISEFEVLCHIQVNKLAVNADIVKAETANDPELKLDRL